MVFFQYDAHILPEITLIGQNTQTCPHQNIRRVSDDYIFYIVTEGEMYFVEDGTQYHLHKGDCFLFTPKKLHYGICDSCYQIQYIHFRHPAVKQIEHTPDTLSSEGFVTLPKYMHISDIVGLKQVITAVNEAIAHNYSRLENSCAFCACAVHQVFLELYRIFTLTDEKRRGSARCVDNVLAFLHANYQRKLTGAVLEKELSYNFDYLNQIFHRACNSSIFQMLETIRMEAARNLILTSELSVEQIALEVGYKDATYFSKVFKKHHEIPPLQYRQKKGL